MVFQLNFVLTESLHILQGLLLLVSDGQDVAAGNFQLPPSPFDGKGEIEFMSLEFVWLVVSTPLKNMLVKLDHFPR